MRYLTLTSSGFFQAWRRLDGVDVGDHAGDPRRRLLHPVHSGGDLLDAEPEGGLALVEPVHVPALAGVLRVPVAELHVPPHGDPVRDVVGQQVQPLLVAALVQQVRLGAQELVHLLREQQVGETLAALRLRSATLRTNGGRLRFATPVQSLVEALRIER